MATPHSHSSIARPQPHRCPWWLGWALASPVRGWFDRPQDLLSPHLRPGYRALEIGPGMGFYTLPMAELVGTEGRIYCVDVQPRMLRGLERRLKRRHLESRVDTRCCTATDLGVGDLAGTIDLAVLIYVLHEVTDPERTLREIATTLRPEGRLLFVEPRGHVSAELFQQELAMARDVGLTAVSHPACVSSGRRQMALLSRDP